MREEGIGLAIVDSGVADRGEDAVLRSVPN
jgi:hypothetical protein